MIFNVLECSSRVGYHDSVPRVGRAACVARVGTPPFVEGSCLPAREPVLIGGM